MRSAAFPRRLFSGTIAPRDDWHAHTQTVYEEMVDPRFASDQAAAKTNPKLVEKELRALGLTLREMEFQILSKRN